MTPPVADERVPDEERRPELDDAPPVLGSWRNVYLLVIGNLAVLVLLFWLLSEAHR